MNVPPLHRLPYAPAPALDRESRLTRLRSRLLQIRGELSALKSYVASDAVQHAVNLLDRTRAGDGNRR